MRLTDKLEWKCPTLKDLKQESRIKSEHGTVVAKISSDKEKEAREVIKENRELYNKTVANRGDVNAYFITKYNTPKKLRELVMMTV